MSGTIRSCSVCSHCDGLRQYPLQESIHLEGEVLRRNKLAAAPVIGALAAAFTLISPMTPAHAADVNISSYIGGGSCANLQLANAITAAGDSGSVNLEGKTCNLLGGFTITKSVTITNGTLNLSGAWGLLISTNGMSVTLDGVHVIVNVDSPLTGAIRETSAFRSSITIVNSFFDFDAYSSRAYVVSLNSVSDLLSFTNNEIIGYTAESDGSIALLQDRSLGSFDTNSSTDELEGNYTASTQLLTYNRSSTGIGYFSPVYADFYPSFDPTNLNATWAGSMSSPVQVPVLAGGCVDSTKVPTASSLVEPAGYQLAGWVETTSSASAPGTTGRATDPSSYSSASSSSCSPSAAKQSFWAFWTMIEFKVTFDANTGAYAGGVTSMDVQTVNDYVDNPSSMPTKPGFAFAGWFTQPNNTGGPFYVRPDPSATKVSGDMRVYAHWTPISIPTSAKLTVAKTAIPVASALPLKAGDKVTWDLTAANSGNVPLTGVVLSDSLSSVALSRADANANCPVAAGAPAKTTAVDLAVGATIHCTATYTLTQADIDAGSVTNSASASGRDGGDTVTGMSGLVPVSLRPNASIGLEFDTATLSGDGSSIDFVFKATNTGNVTLTNVNLSQVSFNGNLPGDPPCDITTLAPNDWTYCHAQPYNVVPNDRGATITADALVEGTANGVGVVTGSSTVNATARGSFTIPSKQKPHESKPSHKSAPSIDLTSNGGALSADGSQITYKFTITNDGNTSLSSVALIQMGFTGAGKPSISCATNRLAPGATTTCTVTYTVQPADVGTTVTFTGEAQGMAGGTKVKSDDVPASVIVPAATTPTTPVSPKTPSSGTTVIQTGGSVASSMAGLVAVTLLVAAGGVLLVSRRRLAVH